MWRVFPLQQLAFEAADSAPKAADIAVMSFETRSGGGRKFIACTEDEFWRRYRLPAARECVAACMPAAAAMSGT